MSPEPVNAGLVDTFTVCLICICPTWRMIYDTVVIISILAQGWTDSGSSLVENLALLS